MKQITITVYRSELCRIKVWSSKIHPTKYSPFITAGDQLENLQFFVVYFFIQNHKAVSSIQFSNSDVFGFTNKSEDINPVLYFLTEHKDAPMTFKTSLYRKKLKDKISPFVGSVFSISCMRVLSLLCSADPATRVRETFSSLLKA